MGPEMESHVITQSTLIYVPANYHPLSLTVFSKVTRPFIFIQSQYSGKLTETSLRKLVAQELRTR